MALSTKTDPTQDYVAAFEAAKTALPGAAQPWLAALRDDAIRRFADTGFPTPRVEDWKYTNLNQLTRAALAPSTAAAGDADVSAWVLERSNPYRVVLVDGCFAPGLSDLDGLPKGAVVTALSQTIDGDAAALEGRLGSVAALNGSGLVALNTALMRDGLVVRLARNAVIERPIHLIHLATDTGAAGSFHPRNLILADEGSEATVIETYAGQGGDAYWTNAVTEVDAGKGARVRHLKLQEEGSEAFHIGLAKVRLARDAAYESFVLSTGAALSRNEIRVAVEGEGASCRLTGGSLLRGRQHSDITSEIDHRVPHGESAQLFKNVLDDRSRSVFQGRVIVQPDAQKTDAHQNNRNLLLSPRAQADTKPELQIFADDVKCSHGATVGDLDTNALFYLLSRGIDAAHARRLLIEAFASELLGEIGQDALREDVSSRLSAWLAAESGELEKAA